MPIASPKRIAIACQGGGSHTAFTAGVLQSLLHGLDPTEHRVIGLSGTSGGALCATLAWSGLLEGDVALAISRLERFWQGMAANDAADYWTNQGLQALQRSRSLVAWPQASPYLLPNVGQPQLAEQLAAEIPFDRLSGLINPDSPCLMIGAVEVLSGAFTVFHSHATAPDLAISVEALLASAAIPELFRAVRIGDGVYWDGLFSQNPPIRGFLSGKDSLDAKPDEIWVIRINPAERAEEPILLSDIEDRRNELAGNLSLHQELDFVQQANDWLAKGWLDAKHFKHVEPREISMNLDLDYASKLDRSPAFIERLLTHGRRQGSHFLEHLKSTP